jgi:tetratricopeptide (TPR) repeat protein
MICYEEETERIARLKGELELLTESLDRGSNVPRTTFYLAQTYRDLGNLPRAIEHYEERLKMGGWEEEIWYSMYQIGCLQQRLGMAWMIVLHRFLDAHQLRPSRAEALYRVAKYYRETGQYRLGHLFAKAVLNVPEPDDLLFIERTVYEYELRLEYALCCFHLGVKHEAASAAEQILVHQQMPERVREAALSCIS